MEGRHHLAAELDQAPVGQLGLLHASARPRSGLQHDHVGAAARQSPRRRKAGQTGAHNHHVVSHA